MRRLFLFALLGVSVLALLLSDLPFGLYLYGVERDQLITQLQRDAFILGGRAEEGLENGTPEELAITRDLAVAYRDEGGARVVIVDNDGIAQITNDPDDSREGLNYGTRPEIIEALAGRVVSGHRFSETLGVELVYVAVPIYSGQHVVGAVRLTFEESAVDDAVNRQLIGVYLVALVTLLFAVVLAIVLSRVLSRNLNQLGAAAKRLSKGDLSSRAPEPKGPKELRDVSTAFNLMANRLELLVGEQKAFAADASHQLRTPLTALQLRIERLRDKIKATKATEQGFDEIESEISRMRRLIEGLLALGRASSDSLTRESVDAAEVVRQRVEEWSSLAEEAGIALSCQAPQSARALAVPTAIEQIVDNFIDNAISILSKGGAIDVTVTEELSYVVISVADNGPGISAADAHRAFDRFWRGNATHEGTGLGLAIVRQLAQASGGSVSLTPGETGGTVARVTLERP
ncbi:MAG: sensor histidine kinase [Aquiluna sp.]